MKFYRLKHLVPAVAFALAMGTSSCIGDLNVDPTIDKSTSVEFNRDPIFAKIYANMALTGNIGPAGNGDIDGIDEGTSDFFRQLWNMNELPTDEAVCCWGDAGVPEYNFAQWDASHGMMTAMYYRLYFGITMANYFLENTVDDATATDLRAEARFLRALYYYYAMDFYGNIPLIVNVSTEQAEQSDRKTIYEFIEKELLECVDDMKEPRTNTYGRADKAAAWLLLARLYLNAEVYTGTPQWGLAVTYAEKVLESGYTLCKPYKNLFMGDNNTNGAQNEIILPILQDGIDTQNYGCGTFLIAATHKTDMNNAGTSENWAGNRARKQMMTMFFPNNDAPNVDENEMVRQAKDDRALFYGKDRELEVEDISNFTHGYSCAKFTNKYSTGATPKDAKFVDMDVPFMRVAEAYLILAEAKTRLELPNEAKPYIDDLRDRANATKQPTYSLNDICDEWCREFAFEGRRRIDLIRFGKFGGNTDYVWDWKGGTKEGTNFDAYRNLYPIPTKERVANPNLEQNFGY